jgi:predicted component of type VI protein secretion system
MAVYLIPVRKGHTIVLDKAVVFVGRHPDCDVVLTNSRKVSRKHCCICQVNETYLVRDLGSMNGIRVNGQRVRKEARVNFGDELSIGDVAFTLQKQKSAAPPRHPPADRTLGDRTLGERSVPPKAARPAPPPPPKRPAPKTPSRRDDLSQEFPVAVPDDGESFAVYAVEAQDDDDLPEAIIVDDDSASGSDGDSSV